METNRVTLGYVSGGQLAIEDAGKKPGVYDKKHNAYAEIALHPPPLMAA